MEVRPVREVSDPVEAERVCAELRAHGIKCDYTKLAEPAQEASVLGFDGLVPGGGERLYVVVGVEDVDRASAILQT